MTKARASLKGMAAIAAVATLLPLCGIEEIASPPDIVEEEMRIPTRESGKKGLEAVMVRPNDATPHPLALMTHGSPRDRADRTKMTPQGWIPQAREFARRGWTVVIVMRRGFGDSGGGFAEDSHACTQFPNYQGATKEAVVDLRAAAAYLVTRPEVDPSRMIAVGRSTGGMAMVGLAADPPPGLMAAISFAGGGGSDSPDHVCNPSELAQVFAAFGRRARVPMLWVYAANDHYFGPQLAQALYRAFTQGGGNVRFILTGPFGEDGHHLFSQAGIPIWTPIVDDFLKSHNLILRDAPLEIPLPAVEPPAGLSEVARDGFQRYLLGAPHKAFAVSPAGHFGLSSGKRTAKEAEKQALENCKRHTQKNDPCTIVMIDDEKTQN